MEKVLISGAKAVIRTNSGERAEALSNILWTYKPDTFLPHGTARDGNADKQPIWITPDEENPNCAEILVLTDGALAGDLSTWQRCIEIFDGRNESERRAQPPDHMHAPVSVTHDNWPAVGRLDQLLLIEQGIVGVQGRIGDECKGVRRAGRRDEPPVEQEQLARAR